MNLETQLKGPNWWRCQGEVKMQIKASVTYCVKQCWTSNMYGQGAVKWKLVLCDGLNHNKHNIMKDAFKSIEWQSIVLMLPNHTTEYSISPSPFQFLLSCCIENFSDVASESVRHKFQKKFRTPSSSRASGWRSMQEKNILLVYLSAFFQYLSKYEGCVTVWFKSPLVDYRSLPFALPTLFLMPL